jgi:hypothetical protein
MSIRWTNRFWSVSLELTLFLEFLKLFVKMCLAASFAGKNKSYFLNLRIKSYGCLKFLGEVWAGRACAGANEEELTTCGKIWGQRGRKEGAGGLDKGRSAQERSTTAGRRPPTAPRPAVANCWLPLIERSLVSQRLPNSPATAGRGVFFIKKLELIFFYFLKALACCKGLGCFGGCVHSTPIF